MIWLENRSFAVTQLWRTFPVPSGDTPTLARHVDFPYHCTHHASDHPPSLSHAPDLTLSSRVALRDHLRPLSSERSGLAR